MLTLNSNHESPEWNQLNLLLSVTERAAGAR